jgi:hypothetical protein
MQCGSSSSKQTAKHDVIYEAVIVDRHTATLASLTCSAAMEHTED